MLNKLLKLIQKPLGFVLKNWKWLSLKANKIAINSSVNVCRHRPHPWSTVHDYVSWTSLTDKTWSARHRPAKRLNPPKNDNLEDFFKQKNQPSGQENDVLGDQRMSKKSTCLFPAFAQYLTDGFIRTKMPDKEHPDEAVRKQNTSNHEIDLSPLYGRTPEQTAALRQFNEDTGKKGKLKFQMIGEEEYAHFLYEGNVIKPEFEILDSPLMSEKFKEFPHIISKLFAFGGDRANASPQVAMMNTLFLREHNRLAGVIEAANPGWNDERVFQVARNITIVLFIKLVVEEYINHISPLSHIFKLVADPSVAWNAPWNKPNWITTEFSLLYRWHSLIPDEMKWGGGKSHPAAATIMNNNLLLDVGLKKAFAEMSAQATGEIGAFNTTTSLLGMEKKAIEQGRLVQLASYNEYREYVKLDKRKNFSEVSSNPKVVEFLQNAYHSVDDIEFYIGLFAEDLEKNSPLPELLNTMVAVDAFSQALTNPLLSEHVWNEGTFTKEGWQVIKNTKSLRDILHRNVKGGLEKDVFIGMTLSDWKPE